MNEWSKKLSKSNTVSAFLNRYPLSHANAVLLLHPDTLYLKEIAKLMIAKSVCVSKDKPCLECPNCQKVLHKTAVDVFSFPTTEKKELLVGDAEQIIDSLLYCPADFEHKYYAIFGMDNANTAFQNKLLKSIEEPPKFVKYVSTAESTKTVLPTILSRFQVLSVPSLTANELLTLLKDDRIEQKRLAMAVELSSGMIGKAQEILQDDSFVSSYEFCKTLLSDMTNTASMLSFSSKLVNEDEDLEQVIFILKSFYADLLSITSGKPILANNQSILEQLKIVAKGYTAASVLEILNSLEQIQKQLKSNCNRSAVIDNFLLHILEVKYHANRSWR